MVSDLISRQDAIKAVANYLWHYPNEQYKNLNVFEIAESLAKDALSVVPSKDRPTGEWIMKHDGVIFKRTWGVCSRCRNTLDFDGLNAGRGNANYCPNCGAKMRGEEG